MDLFTKSILYSKDRLFSRQNKICRWLYEAIYKYIDKANIPELQLYGNRLYHETLNMATVLTKHWRSTPEYAKMLDRWRFNEPSLADIDLINSRLLSKVAVRPDPTTKFVYPDNKRRECLNNFAFQKILKKNRIKLLMDAHGKRQA